MGGCAAVNCTNSSKKGFRMFRFPSNVKRKKKWIINCRRSNWQSGSGALLCEVHFEEFQLEINKKYGHNKLRPDAILISFNVQNSEKIPRKRLKEIGCPKPGSDSDKLESSIV
ncbi:THAP domain-containing protein 2-like [Parasteatoda tepidariorum]|uniref:THAP domain-containing protein 2-like n=1 Tax=Parasteatoda tepidariorum TaxID=114398 RepID=UPI00077FBBDF